MEAQVVAASLHQRGGKRASEGLLECGQVFVEDLFLEVFGAGRDEHSVAAENSGYQVGERLARAGARLRAGRGAAADDGGYSFGHSALPLAWLVVVHRSGERAIERKDARH